MFKYAAKRVSLSAKLFAALLIATTVGTTFFTGASVASDVVTRQAGKQALNSAVIDFYVGSWYSSYYDSFADITTLDTAISGVEGINSTEIIGYCRPDVAGEFTGTFILTGVQNDSLVTRGMKLVTGSKPLGANETYVCTDSPDLNALSLLGSIITLNFTLYAYSGMPTSASWNLTVKGVVSLSDRSLSIAKEDFYQFNQPYSYQSYSQYSYSSYQYRPNILIVSWSETFAELRNYVRGVDPQLTYSFQTGVIASTDRDQLINTYNVEGAAQQLTTLEARLNNVARQYESNVQSIILYALQSTLMQLMLLRLTVIGVAVLVFIIAWLMGNAASEVSFNLRRKEIGLLSARGFTRRNIMKLFLTEAIIIGLIAGLVGLLIGLLVVPLIFGPAIPPGEQALEYVFRTAGIQTAVITMVVGVLLAVFTVYRAARKASAMKTIDALKEYTHVEETKKPFKSKTVWFIFLLGTYKMVAWMIGLNLLTLMFSLYSNIVLFILVMILFYVDSVLNLLGPIFFLYGTVKLVTQGSVRLQRKVGSVGRRAFGESGLLATRNVQRNPARNVAIAFLIALVVGYGVMTIGASASTYDYNCRQICANVGADVSTRFTPLSNVTYLSSQVANIPGVSAVTLERYVYASITGGSLTLKAVDPAEWRQVAYYEESWFRGASSEEAFQSMTRDNFTIILESGVASYLSLSINSTIAITFDTLQGDPIYSFRVVGLFGPKPVQNTGFYTYGSYYYLSYWSYVPVGALDQINATSSHDQLLAKLNPNANVTLAVQGIESIENATNTLATSLELESMYSNYFVSGPQNVQNIGIALAIVGVSLEVSVVVLITFLERRKELTILSVRGMSSRQISSILLLETLSIVGFAIGLGVLVGLIIVLGTVNSGAQSGQLVTQRLVFPLSTVMLMVGIIALVIMAVVIPIIIAARRAPSDARKKGGW